MEIFLFFGMEVSSFSSSSSRDIIEMNKEVS